MRAKRYKHVLIFALYIFVSLASLVLSQPQPLVTPSAFKHVTFNPNRHQKNLVQVLSAPPEDDPQLSPDPPLSSPLAGSGLISTNLILVSTLDGSIHGIDRFKCKIIWTMRGGPDSQLVRTNSASAFRSAASPAGKRGAKAERSTFDEGFTDEWKAETGLQYSGMDEAEDSEPPVSEEDVVYIVEPKGDGALYMYIKGKPLQKLNLSIKQLANMSPFHADGTVYISSKSTKLIAIDPHDGRLLQRFGNDGADESLILGKKDLPLDVIFLGKNEYKVSIYHNNMLKWNVTYNEYVPNTLDADFDLPPFPSGLYFAPDATGAITAININDGELAWTIEMKFPAVSTFEVYYRPDGGFVIKQQPTPPLIPNKGTLGRKLDQLDRRMTAYIGQMSGSFYAMSTDSFPLMRMARWANGRDPAGGRLPGIGQGVWPEDDDDDDDDDDDGRREPARCSLGSPHFASCLEGQHNIDMAGPIGYIESPEAVKQRKLLEEAALVASQEAALANSPNARDIATQQPPRKTIPEPSRFLEEGPGRFWQTYLLFTCAVVYYYRVRIRELYNTRIEPILEPVMLPYLARMKPYLERTGIVAATREAIDPSKLDEIFGEKGKKESKKKKKGTNKAMAGSGSGGSNGGSSGGLLREGEEEQQNGVIGKTVKFNEEFVEKEKEKEAEVEAEAAKSEAPPAGGPTKLNSLSVTNTILGYGSHGTVVYKGTFDGRDVAVKRLLLDFYDVAYHEVTLLEESDDHPNVIRYYCKEEANRFLYIALELCQASLYDAIEQGPSSPHVHLLETVHPTRVLYQIIAGLRHLHSLKIVHRDIKPQNILLAPAKPHHRSGQHSQHPGGGTVRVMISDFGLCKKLEADQSSFHNTTASAAGTIGWRAPELLSQTLEEPEEDAVFIDSANLDTVGFTTVSTSSSSHSSPLAVPVRITKAIDIFSAGCVFYYVLSGGEHPFGDKFSREINIIKGVYSLDRLSGMGEDGVEARDLIERMIAREPRNRPDAETILLHPYFWTPAQRLAFLQDASDRFEIEDRDPPSPLIQRLECDGHEIVGPDWYKRIDRFLVNDLRKFRKYDGKMIRDLLRALRNKKHHWQDLAEPLKRSLGQPPDDYLFYFTSRFPRLFLHTYYIIAEDEHLRAEHMFRHYFEIPHTLR